MLLRLECPVHENVQASRGDCYRPLNAGSGVKDRAYGTFQTEFVSECADVMAVGCDRAARGEGCPIRGSSYGGRGVAIARNRGCCGPIGADPTRVPPFAGLVSVKWIEGGSGAVTASNTTNDEEGNRGRSKESYTRGFYFLRFVSARQTSDVDSGDTLHF